MRIPFRIPFLALCVLMPAFLSSCKEEKKVIYIERIAILPDASGLLVKEMRADAQDKPLLALIESRQGKERELAVVPLAGAADVKFRFTVRGDTILLFHEHAGLQAALAGAVHDAAFPVRFEVVEGARWLTAGTEEGHAIFYAPGKWKAFLDLSRKD